MKAIRVMILVLAMVLVLQCASIGIIANTNAMAASGDKQYIIWFDEAAPESVEGFERWSLPLGNGYMGINVFGGVESELISVTENSVFNPSSSGKGTLDSATGIYYNDFGDERIDASSGGLNLMAKTYIDFTGHTTDGASNYKRELSINDSVAKVSYDYDGVTYTREYFSSYPDKVTVMRLSASEAGKLSFTLRPEIPFCYDPEVDATKYSYLNKEGDGYYKTGKVTAEGDTITLKGTMAYLGTDFEGLYKVIPTGGSMVAANDANGKNGTITVTDADSVVIILAAGTNYDYEYITFDQVKGMLDGAPDPHEKVQGWLDTAAAKTYDALLEGHQADFKALFDRASLDLGGVFDDTLTTDLLVSGYGTGNAANDRYLEEMTFQYGRYLLIASSREGCLPSNLQGIWNFADSAAWSGGYWHNINIQMNYWPAFNTGLSELFQSYVDYNVAMRDKAQTNADSYLKSISAPGIATVGTGENGYTIGTGCNPYNTASTNANGHSGPGTVAFTSLLFWDWYEFTQDETVLSDYVYPAVEGAAKFLSKTVKQYEDGTYLVYKSASPENGINNVYIHTVGSAFDQQMVYANHLATLEAAEILGYTAEDYPILTTIKEQVDKLDPVKIGYSGQVKEYREENYYGEYGEKNHRHISQLVGVYPADLINGDTDAWLDAAGVSLENRGYTNIGWGVIHRMLCWARIHDGEQAFEELELMMTEHLGYSLLSNYNSSKLANRKHNNPFQIEANFGYTAAVAEMLVQSQAGYIEFMPALPEAWSTGSFQGLTTRGNFSVDAAWTDGVATEFKIYSGSGKDCSVKYPNIASAVVKDSQGNTVTFTAEGDVITFATTEGETYTISSIPSHTPNLAAPTGLSLEASGTKMDLSWTASEGASSYNVYRAVNDEASYTLVEEGVTATSYTYNHTDIQGYDRVTMRVTAVAADGTESTSALAYALPVTGLNEVTGYMFEGNDLQLEYAAAENATEYRVYADGEMVATSTYTVAAVRDADPTATYTVSAVAEGRESAATQATVYHVSQQDNIMLNKPMTLEGRPYWIAKSDGSLYDGALAVNGNTATNNANDRWAVSESMEPFSVTADLQGIYKLGTLKIYEWKSNASNTRSDNTTVEILDPNGKWQTVKAGFALNHGGSVTVDMGGVLATQIRFTFQNTDEKKSACIAEITCTGEKIDKVNKVELFGALQSYGGQDVTASSFAGVPVAYILAEPEAQAALVDQDADQRTVDKTARALIKAATGTNLFLNRSINVNLKEISGYPATLMVDGITDSKYVSRWAVSEGANSGTTENTAVVTITLDGLHHLEGVFVQEFLQADSGVERKTNGGDVTIEVSADGSQWTTVLSGASLRETRDKRPYANCSNTAFVFDNAVLAGQVRLTFVDSVGAANKAISIHEIQAYGKKVDESGLYLSSNLLTLDSGSTHTLTASLSGVTWSSSDPSVVSVDSDGKLTADNRGYAVITATDGTNTVSCEVFVLGDTSLLEEAIAEAKTALNGVQGIDRTADRVIAGVKFVPTARLTALTNAIATAEVALPNATSAELVQSAAAALTTELNAFNAALATGTMDITNHSHCVCTGVQDHDCAAVTWTAWGDDEAERTSLPVATGNYFLVDDITISKNYNIGSDNPSVVVSLCLNGFNVEATHTGEHVYNVYSDLNVCDCAAEENWGSIIGNDTGSVGATIQLRDNRSNKGGVLNFYSGIITAKESAVSTLGGLIMIGNTGENGSVLNMYGGKLCGGRAKQGGAVAIRGCGSFNMYGGTVCENFADSGAVAVILDFGNPGAKINIYGGTMGASKNLSGAAVSDFAIFDAAGVLQISGGTFVDGLSVEDTTLKDSLAENVVIVKSADGSVVDVDDTGTSTGSAAVVVCSGAFTAETASLTLSTDTVEYDGRNDTPVPEALVKFGATTLVKDTHYTISYQRNGTATTDLNNPGDITVVVTGMAPYSGTLTASYTIINCVVVDRSALEAAISQYGNLNMDAASFAGTPLAYQLTKAQAAAVLADENATQAQVDAAAANLTNAATKDNIFFGQTIVADRVQVTGYPADLLVDEIVDGKSRYAMSYGNNKNNLETVSFTVTLDEVYKLEALFFQEYLNLSEYVSRAKSVKVEAFVDGQWVTLIADGKAAGKSDKTNFSDITGYFLENPVETNMVRITFTHASENITSSGQLITLYELQAYGEKVLPTDDNLRFASANLALHNDLSVVFNVDKAAFEAAGFSDPYVEFVFGGTVYRVADFSQTNGKLGFRLRQIAPYEIGETITATLYATKDGVLYAGKPITYSIKQYCERMLARYSADSYAEFRTLLVDLLNYGAAAQKYMDPAISDEALVNNWLTSEQRAWGTAQAPEVSNAAAKEEVTLPTAPSVTCEGVGLYLCESIAIRFKFKAESLDGLSVKFTMDGKSTEITEFIAVEDEEGCYYVYFKGLNASQIRETVKAVVYQNGVAVSNTFCYSAECYIANHIDDNNESLLALVKAVACYGVSAEAYVK